ncbi:DUF397 domain-containing protein [Nocardia farcinica]|uniref:DUF397 domain-containing protein n=1 Tax=Nocardia farcinica TaxID=37329 RepID=UPI0018963C47|nr:DUF397 domain-containing protein [Nocardia farcinica]MBF6388177.1 DUF397 domain-containing protein [Nocardia farcinica]UEX26321.1 DUF397 domain-containing protein [Nocardia farcinica]
MDVSTTAHLNWFKATLSSSSSSCVEVADAGRVVLVRDSKYLRDPRNREREQPTIGVPANRWREFLDLVGNRHCAGDAELPAIEYHPDGGVSLRRAEVTLTYTAAEWHAFCDGVQKGEFDCLVPAAA